MKKSTKCKCGKRSTKGCHGIKDLKVYSEYYCDECYNDRESVKTIKNEDENEISKTL